MNVYIDTDALINNAVFLKNKVAPAKLCAVVKNNAYGHGIDTVCKALSGIADYFAVGNIDEALVAKKYCDNVLVLLPILSVTDTLNAIMQDICLTADSQETLLRIINAGKICNKKAKVHIKLDSGMARLGYDCRRIAQWLPQLSHAVDSNSIEIVGMYSHFACADSDIEYTQYQQQQFMRAVNTVSRVTKKDFIKHIANSSASLCMQNSCCDMVRCGLSLYGYGSPYLKPVKKVTAKVLAIRELYKGDRLGYDSVYVCSHDTRVAVLDIGYANGLDRVLSSKVNFEFNGKEYRQIGNICMAMSMVDIKDSNIEIGQEMTLLSASHYPIIDKSYSVYQLLCDLR